MIESQARADRGLVRKARTTAADLLGAELADLTRSELFAVVPPSGHSYPFMPALIPRLLGRGITVRILHSYQRDWGTPAFLALERRGAVIRSTIVLQQPVMIRDRSFLYFSHPDTGHPLCGRSVRVRNDELARLLAATFDAIWTASADSSRNAPTTELRDLARLLNNGLTDDRAAAQLHISKRTFARRMASMMSVLGAESRFQAGAQAAKRGWLS